MAGLRLYNSLTRTVEDFSPADGTTVRLYTCGPTVYNPAHLGNFRTFLFEDLLRRTLQHVCGWKVRQVMNLTDVDDKIIARAAERGVTITQLTAPVIAQFYKDRDFLRIEPAEVYPRATEYIPQMIRLVQKLEQRGLAYRADDGSVYFSIQRFPGYGKLSRLDTREIKTGARVAQDDYSKDNAQDFALWKAAKQEDEATEAAWDSPWGRGRPGWHLECSAMAMEELGETLDIHCGGVDLVFPHHEDEIAQSEGATGTPFSRFWCHGAFLLTEGAKMAKRVGNVWTVEDLRTEGISPFALRHFVFSTHYRKELNLVRDALDASAVATRRLGTFRNRLAELTGAPGDLGVLADAAEAGLREALLDDLNAPEALAALFTFVRQSNTMLADSHPEAAGATEAAVQRARHVLDLFDGCLGVIDEVAGAGAVAVPTPALAGSGVVMKFGAEVAEEARQWLADLVIQRDAYRRARNFAESDRIRGELAAQGYQVEDSAGGYIVRRA
jgi:cysteinyl-tRNA synthetase